MTPWQRLDAELARRRGSWASLAAQLEISKQAIGHWKTRGIPAKFMRRAAESVGKTIDWLEYGNDYLAQAEEFDEWQAKQNPIAYKAHHSSSMVQVPAEASASQWPFDPNIVSQQRYMALPDAVKTIIQVKLLEAIREEESLLAKQEAPHRAKQAQG